MASIRDELLREINRFLDETGMLKTEFGKRACNDPAMVGRLEQGRHPTTRTIERIRAFIAKHSKRSAA